MVSSDSKVIREFSASDLHCTVRFMKLTLRLFLCNHNNFRITDIFKSTEIKGLQVYFQTLNVRIMQSRLCRYSDKEINSRELSI